MAIFNTELLIEEIQKYSGLLDISYDAYTIRVNKSNLNTTL